MRYRSEKPKPTWSTTLQLYALLFGYGVIFFGCPLALFLYVFR